MATFLDYYRKKIQPRVMAADLFLKTEQEPYALHQALDILQMSQAAAQHTLQQEIHGSLTKAQFIRLLCDGKTAFCRMFASELRCGLPAYYTPAQISYIYDLDVALVEQAAAQTGLVICTRRLLPLVFSAIDLSQTQYRL